MILMENLFFDLQDCNLQFEKLIYGFAYFKTVKNNESFQIIVDSCSIEFDLKSDITLQELCKDKPLTLDVTLFIYNVKDTSTKRFANNLYVAAIQGRNKNPF